MTLVLRAPMRDAGLRLAADRSADTYLTAMRARFSLAAGGNGTWPDLAPSTKLARLRKAGMRYRRKKGVTGLDRLRQAASVKLPILMDTLRLYESLSPGSPGSYRAYGPDRVAAGTSVWYARFHQNPGVPGRPPQRRILIPPPQDLLDRMAVPLWDAVAAVSASLTRRAIAA